MTRTGVWLIGVRGNIATTAIVGARAIANGAASRNGMVTERAPFDGLELPGVENFVFGGHDIRNGSVSESAAKLSELNGVPDRDTLAAVEDDLDEIDARIESGTARRCGSAVAEMATDELDGETTVADLTEQIRADYSSFAADNALDRVVVVNVASTEPALDDPDRYGSVESVEQAIEENDRDLPASSLYAYAAFAEGHPYANFTPSTGSSLSGLRELAEERGVPHMGNDGKTGESLVKAALAPMFAGRNLRVLSWEGHNILGNEDGRVLESDENKAGKLASKGGILSGIFDYPFHNRVRIDYTPSLDDWKTAWDYIHFEGFLDTQMKMQFTWEGSDSALAAPLVLDLVRLLAHADERDEGGLQPHLASFFKAPLGVDEHDLSLQLDRLYEYASDQSVTVPEEASAETVTD